MSMVIMEMSIFREQQCFELMIYVQDQNQSGQGVCLTAGQYCAVRIKCLVQRTQRNNLERFNKGPPHARIRKVLPEGVQLFFPILMFFLN